MLMQVIRHSSRENMYSDFFKFDIILIFAISYKISTFI